jgi:sugar/nucleoside kinase (ribokinase family)
VLAIGFCVVLLCDANCELTVFCAGFRQRIGRRSACKARRVISLDPNIRPGFIKNKEAHLSRVMRMAAKSDILKFSDEDLAWFGLEGGDDDLAALRLASSGS